MSDLKPPILEPFNYQAASKRNTEFLIDYLQAAFGGGDPFADPEQRANRFRKFMSDAAEAFGEINRLYAVFDSLKRRHMPHAGEPGAPVKCTSCSMHGGEVPWPCETYKAADAALPEGWPL